MTAPAVLKFGALALAAVMWATAVAAACAGTDAGTAPADFSEAGLARIDGYFAHELSTGTIPGAIVLIQRHGRPAYLSCFGIRDAATGLAMTPDTIFRVFSMTKPITAVTTMMLVDQGRLRLDDPLSKFIPAFADVKVGVERAGPDGAPRLELEPLQREITIEDLLRQSSGLTYGFYGLHVSLVRKAYAAADLFRGYLTNEVLVDRLAQLPLVEQPGTVWDYGHSMEVLGRVIEIVTGKSLYQAMKEMLLDPLGMTRTAYYVADPARFPLIANPLPSEAGFATPMQRDVYRPVEFEAGGTGLVSTVGDYARFAQMLLNGGSVESRRYLSPAAFATMTSNHIAPATAVRPGDYYFPGDGYGYGFGVSVRISPGKFNAPGSIGEFGWTGSGGTYFFVDPKLDMFVLLMLHAPSQRGRIWPEFKKLVYEALTP
jgi:CubicO group peptidase (beta-lactamase class C family)